MILFSVQAFGQSYTISGNILEEDGSAMAFATAVLLNPSDSTLEYYGISNDDGFFEIKNIRGEKYLMQVAFIGYETIYRDMDLPGQQGNAPLILVMREKSLGIDEVQVVGEAVPIIIKRDTIEYNRAAYKLREDDVVEDLLKKLPGIVVDRAGNIKALGEDVQRVYVDGKEFFGNDPKVATRNVPARAVNKVQMYDKLSDEAEFTGIDDGSRDKTLNLVLEEDMKKAVFGNVSAGAGTSSLYQANAKAYYFTDKIHLAGLGMLNNMNQFGFSFGDYMDFSGGLSGMMAGSGKIEINADDSFPINFGQPVYGLNTSGAAGLNFSHSRNQNDRVFISYLANATLRDLMENSITRYYKPGESYSQEMQNNEFKGDTAHRVNFGFRQRLDSTRNIIMNGGISLNYGRTTADMLTSTIRNEADVNRLISNTTDASDRVSGSLSGSYINKIRSDRTVFKLTGDVNYNQSLSAYQFNNVTSYFTPAREIISQQFQDNKSSRLSYSGGLYLTQRLSKKIYLVPGFRYSMLEEKLERFQGVPGSEDTPVDSLSPQIEKQYRSMIPGLTFKHNTGKSQLSLSLEWQASRLASTLNDEGSRQLQFNYLLPKLNYEYEFNTGRRINLFYSTSVNEPSVSQLLPVVNNINPIYLVTGNPDLEPEYSHRANAHIFIFDQFSFTSVFGALSAAYTINKINWSRTLNQDLVQELTPVNVRNDLVLRGNVDFSTPVKKLGIKIHLNIEETWNQGISLVDKVENQNTNMNHRISLSADNRKKQKWDINSGVGLTLTNSQFSIQENLNNRYSDVSWFGEILFTPNETWDFMATGDVINYNSESFSEAVLVPMIGYEVNYHFLANKRGVLSLKAFDLLDKNTGIQRLSELNYLREVRRNTIGRYFMVTFTYRLNKFGDSGNHIDIKMKRH